MAGISLLITGVGQCKAFMGIIIKNEIAKILNCTNDRDFYSIRIANVTLCVKYVDRQYTSKIQF